MTRARLKQEMERIWNERDAQMRCNKARWQLIQSQLVLYVGGKYRSERVTDYKNGSGETGCGTTKSCT